MTDLSNKKSFAPGARSSSGTLSLPLMLALAACGGRYELGELLPPDPSGSSGAGSTGFEPLTPEAVGHVIIDELGDLDAAVSRIAVNPVGDIDGDGHDDWFASPSYGVDDGNTPRPFVDQLVYGGSRVSGDLYREDRLGPTVIYEGDVTFNAYPMAAGDLDGDGFGDVLYLAEGFGFHVPKNPDESAYVSQGQWFLEHWHEQRAHVLYGGPRKERSEQIWLREVAVPFSPDEQLQASFAPELALETDPGAESWDVITRTTLTRLGDLDADGFDDLAYTYSITRTGSKTVGDTVVSTSTRTDGVTHVLYGGPNRLPADDALANAAAVLPGVTELNRVGDIDGDGHPDLVAKKNDQVFLVPGGAARLSGSLAPEQVGEALLPADELEGGWTKSMRQAVGVGDLDADGFDDLMVTRWKPLESAALLFYGGPQRFDRTLLDASADATFLIDEPQSMQQVQRLGDWDGDGHEDLMVVATSDDGAGAGAWQSPYSKAVVIRGGSERYSGVLSAGLLAAAPDHRRLDGSLLARPLGDIDGDGRIDLEVRSGSGTFVKYGGPLASVIY